MLADGNTELKLHLSSVDFKLDLKRRTAASDFTFEALVAFVPDRSTLEICKMHFSIPCIHVGWVRFTSVFS